MHHWSTEAVVTTCIRPKSSRVKHFSTEGDQVLPTPAVNNHRGLRRIVLGCCNWSNSPRCVTAGTVSHRVLIWATGTCGCRPHSPASTTGKCRSTAVHPGNSPKRQEGCSENQSPPRNRKPHKGKGPLFADNGPKNARVKGLEPSASSVTG